MVLKAGTNRVRGDKPCRQNTKFDRLTKGTATSSPPENSQVLRPSINPPLWTLWRFRVWSELPQAGMEAGTLRDRGTTRPWHRGLRKLRLYIFYHKTMRAVTDDAVEVRVGLRLPDRAADHAAYCHNYPRVNQARELRHLQCWSSN